MFPPITSQDDLRHLLASLTEKAIVDKSPTMKKQMELVAQSIHRYNWQTKPLAQIKQKRDDK